VTLDRTDYATARPRDVALLAALFSEGRALTKDVGRTRYGIAERRFRAAVAALRLTGMPIVSFSEPGSTYHLAHDEGELDHFINEIRSRRDELDAVVRALSTPEARRRIPRTQLDLAI
jgi:hypothetical protein